ncbi:SRPBCC family protein [Nocardioides terrisoli]|uniref:SRPBCC family protein n=1 Tax=Nocardioides terrisoli TaxID=3388267 RepID=UPI00287B89D8|nr:SRPBCC family protein [Nocardioides marmorisolisilvae]
MSQTELHDEIEIGASPERVYRSLLDVPEVMTCIPGAEFVGEEGGSYLGKVKIKMGPVTVSYKGKAEILHTDADSRLAVLKADGDETTGAGRATAEIKMAVLDGAADPSTSRVQVDVTYQVAGRAAQFGRGLMDEVAMRIIAQMTDNLAARLRAEDADGPDSPSAGHSHDSPESRDELTSRSVPGAVAVSTPINGLSLIVKVLLDKVRRLVRRILHSSEDPQ